MIFTKGFHTAAAIDSVRHLVGPETWALSVQNGLGNASSVNLASLAGVGWPQSISRSIFEADRKPNQPIRELLSVYGLRFSLIRLKVIDALLVATREGRFIGALGTHTQVQSPVAGC